MKLPETRHIVMQVAVPTEVLVQNFIIEQGEGELRTLLKIYSGYYADTKRISNGMKKHVEKFKKNESFRARLISLEQELKRK